MIWIYAAVFVSVTGLFYWLTARLWRGGEELSLEDQPDHVWEAEVQRMDPSATRIYWATFILCAIGWFLLFYGLALWRRALLPACDWMIVSSLWDLFVATTLLDIVSMFCVGDMICYSLYGGPYRLLGLPGGDDRIKPRVGTIAWVLFVLAIGGTIWSLSEADRFVCVGPEEFVDHGLFMGDNSTRYADIVELRTIEGILEVDGRFKQRSAIEFARRDGTTWSSRQSRWFWGSAEVALLEALKAKTGLPVKNYRTSPAK